MYCNLIPIVSMTGISTQHVIYEYENIYAYEYLLTSSNNGVFICIMVLYAPYST